MSLSRQDSGAGTFLVNRWPGAGSSGIRTGFVGPNILVTDINRVTAGGLSSTTTYVAGSMTFTGLTRGMFHALRQDTYTYGQDVYTTVWAHLNLTDYAALAWTKMYTIQHKNGQTTTTLAQHYGGGYFSGVYAAGTTNGLATPAQSGSCGFGLGALAVGAGRYAFMADFRAYLN